MTEVRAGFSPNHLKSAKVGCGLNGFYLKWWYVRKLGTTAWAVKEADPECLQLSELPALRLGRGNRPWFNPVMPSRGGIMKLHGQPSLRTPHCTLVSCVKPTGNVECQSVLSFFLCAHKSLGAKGCCVGQQAQSFRFFSANPCVPPPASSPLLPLCFILFSWRAKQAFREFTFLGW